MRMVSVATMVVPLWLGPTVLPGGPADPFPACASPAVGEWRQYAEPAEAGFSAGALEAARSRAAEIGSDSVLVVHRGRVLLAWGDVTRKYGVYSIRKSFLGALFGIHAETGEIDLEATLAELGVDDDPPLTEVERTARVVDLLKSRSGVYHPAAFETSGMIEYRPERGSHEPGTHWFYNNWDFNTLATVFDEAVGDPFLAFDREIGSSLGMEDFAVGEDTRYRIERDKSIHPAYLFSMSARDLARFGQMWLHLGCWGGRRVVPEAWVRASVTSYSKAFDGGYGYMSWWTYPAHFADEYRYGALREYDSYMTTGSGGQVVWVVPDLEIVFVHQFDRPPGGPRIGAPEYWTLFNAIVAARISEPVPAPTLVDLEWEPWPDRDPHGGSEPAGS